MGLSARHPGPSVRWLTGPLPWLISITPAYACVSTGTCFWKPFLSGLPLVLVIEIVLCALCLRKVIIGWQNPQLSRSSLCDKATVHWQLRICETWSQHICAWNRQHWRWEALPLKGGQLEAAEVLAYLHEVGREMKGSTRNPWQLWWVVAARLGNILHF